MTLDLDHATAFIFKLLLNFICWILARSIGLGPKRDRDVIIGILISGARSSTQSPCADRPSCTFSVCTTEPSKGALPQSGLCQKGPICIRVPREPLWETETFLIALEHSVLWMLPRASGPQGREVWNCGQFPPCVQVSTWAGVDLVHMQARQVGCHGNHFQSVFLLD